MGTLRDWHEVVEVLQKQQGTAKTRKDAVKTATTLLNNNQLKALDIVARTAAGGTDLSEDELTRAPDTPTWARLVVAAICNADSELQAARGRKTGLDKTVPKLLLLAVKKAEDASRVKTHGHLLLKVSASLFEHIKDSLGHQNRSPDLVDDYTKALRVLLPVPSYCVKVSPDTFIGLVVQFMNRLEEPSEEGVPDNKVEAAKCFGDILRNCPFDLRPDVWVDIMAFFRTMLAPQAGSPSVDLRTQESLYDALALFLARWGADCATAAAQVAAALAPVQKELWAAGLPSQALLRVKAFLAARALLRVGALPAGALAVTLAACSTEVQHRAAVWGMAQAEGRDVRLNSAAEAADACCAWQAPLDLLADLWGHMLQDSASWAQAAAEADGEEDLSRRKRPRLTDPWTSACDSSVRCTALLPALVLALRRHGAAASPASRAAVSVALLGAAASSLEVVERGMTLTAVETAAGVWALRGLRELARLDADAGLTAPPPRWADVADALVARCSVPVLGPLVPEAALTLAAVMSRGLVPRLRTPETMVAPFLLSTSQGALATVAALLSRPPDSCAGTLTAGERSAREQAVGWALSALATPPTEAITFYDSRHPCLPPDVRGTCSVLRAACLGEPPPAAVVDAAAAWWPKEEAEEAELRRWGRCYDPATLRPPKVVDTAPPDQAPRLSIPLAGSLLATAGAALARQLEAAPDAAHLFSLAAVAIETSALAAFVVQSGGPEYPCWKVPHGAVEVALSAVLQRVQAALLDRSSTKHPAQVFTSRLVAAARAYGMAASRTPPPRTGQLDLLGDVTHSLRHCLHAIRTFADDAKAPPSKGIADFLFYDDDFEGGTGAVKAPPRGIATQAGTQMTLATQSAGAAAAQVPGPAEAVIAIIAGLGLARPKPAADALLEIFSDEADVEMPGVKHATLHALAFLRNAPLSSLTATIDALREELKVVAGLRNCDSGVWWLQCIESLSHAVRDSVRLGGDVDMDNVSPLMLALDKLCIALCGEAVADPGAFPIINPRSFAHRLRSWGVPAGIALCGTVCSLLTATSDPPDCLSTVVIALACDTRYAVRRASAVHMSDIFAHFDEDAHKKIADDLKHATSSHATTDLLPRLVDSTNTAIPCEEVHVRARRETALLLLGEIAVASAPMEADCIADVIYMANDHPVLEKLALSVLTATARRLGYQDRFGLVNSHVPLLAQRWVLYAYSIDALQPVAALLAPSPDSIEFDALANVYARFLLPRLLETNDRNSTQKLADVCKMESIKALILQHGARTVACLHAFRANGERLGKTAFSTVMAHPNSCMVEAFGGQPPYELYEASSHLILRELLLMVQPDDAVTLEAAEMKQAPVMLTALEVRKAILDLEQTKQVDTTKTSGLKAFKQLWSPNVVIGHLARLHEQIVSSRSTRRLKAALASLSVIFAALQRHDVLAVASTLRYSVHLLLRLAALPALREGAVRELDVLLSQALTQPADSAASLLLSETLWRWVARLASYVDCTALDAGAAAPRSIIILLRKVVIDAPVWLTDAVRLLEPFPNGPVFNEFRAHVSRLSTDRKITFGDRLRRFCDRARLLEPAVRTSGAAELLALLRKANGAAAAAKEKDALVPAVWRLVRLCETLDEDSLRDLAAASLACCCPSDPFAVAFCPDEPGRAQTAPGSRSRRSGSGVGTVVQLDPPELVSSALSFLCGFLVDDDHTVVAASLLAASRLLSSPVGEAALKELDPLKQALLDVVPHRPPKPLTSPTGPATDSLLRELNDPLLWAPPPAGPGFNAAFDAWVCNLCYALMSPARSLTLRLCRSLTRQKADLASALLPYALADLAAGAGAGDAGEPLRRVLTERLVTALNDASGGHRGTHELLRAMLHLGQLRVQAGIQGLPNRQVRVDSADPASWTCPYWLPVPPLILAAAAVRCGACFTALQAVEVHCESANGKLALVEVDALNDAGPLPEEVALALEAHVICGESDGVHGMLRAPHVALQLRKAEHDGAWGRALGTHDALLRAGGAGSLRAGEASAGMLRSLQHLGCPLTLQAAATKLAGGTDGAFREAQMEAAWRTGRWDGLAESLQSSGAPPGFHESLLEALHAATTGELAQCSQLLSRGRACVMRSIALTGAEAAAAVNTAIVRLQLLDEVGDTVRVRWDPSASVSPEGISGAQRRSMEARWMLEHTSQLGGRFDLLEPLLAGRAAVMQAVGCAAGSTAALTLAAAAARSAGLPSTGLSRIQSIKIATSVSGLPGAPGAAWREEEASLLWEDGQYELALRLARAMVAAPLTDNSLSAVLRRASLLGSLGGWLAERCVENSATIVTDNLEKAIGMLEASQPLAKSGGPADVQRMAAALCTAHFRCARFLDASHRSLIERKTTPEYIRAQELRQKYENEKQTIQAWINEYNRDTAAIRKDKQEAFPRQRHRLSQLDKMLNADNAERERLHGLEVQALLGCLHHYSQTLGAGSTHDTQALFRLVALWTGLDTATLRGGRSSDDVASAQTVNRLVKDSLVGGPGSSPPRVPSHKMLPLAWQLVARLQQDDEASLGFQPVLKTLVTRMTREHPYHSLYQLMALCAADMVGGAQLLTAAHAAKVAAAKAVLAEVRRAGGKRLEEIYASAAEVVGAYCAILELPNGKVPKGTPAVVTMPREARSVQPKPLLPILTEHLDVDPTMAYVPDSMVTFRGFKGNCDILNGLSKPRLVVLQGSNGAEYKTLAKGSDDLRQDAVMQQVFAHASDLLGAAAGARARHLRMRTYKVVPFNPQAGVVQWCTSTLPLSEYLFNGNAAAHKRLRPDDLSHDQAWKKMQEESEKPPASRALRATLDEICTHFRPVMHHFFLEKFPSPPVWYERRLAYSRSVAVSSMVGYVIGLGDRHCSNMLIDCTTAEVVHIDLGIAFEQGALLTVPETVPFRLTGDIVDGLGAAGVEGVLRRCCEETLGVLRANRESLLTLVEVLIHDPITKWTMTREKANRRQAGTADEVDADDAPREQGVTNADAERALLRVRQKLSGQDGADGEVRSVAAQVQALLQEAQDRDRLCVLFHGWAPWV